MRKSKFETAAGCEHNVLGVERNSKENPPKRKKKKRNQTRTRNATELRQSTVAGTAATGELLAAPFPHHRVSVIVIINSFLIS